MLEARLICHTHWDREWYLTQSQFRPSLVRLIDGLLDLAENAPDYLSFMLDGQTIALEDYLQIKPYNRDRLVSAVQRGKIIIGPWYILPDELLISGESHIRNFLTGAKIAKDFGPTMKVGYLPDSFGHPAQMPQILQGLGLDTIVFWRGASNEMDKTEFYWQAPDGESTVFCVNMPNGYATAARLGTPCEDTLLHLNGIMDVLGPKASTNLILLMNGSDHLHAEKRIPEIIAAFNARYSDKKITFSTMEGFLEELRSRVPADLKTFTGNLCYGDKTILLGSTTSTRVYLKQANHMVQKKLERYLEPIIVHERLLGGGFDFTGYQHHLSKLLLENHPHDSICGCSVDKLHDEMETRFMVLEQLEDQLYDDTIVRLQGEESIKADAQLMVFEPNQDSLLSYAEVEVLFDRIQKQSLDYFRSSTKELPGKLKPIPKNIRAEDENGNSIPCFMLSAEPCEYSLHFSDFDQPQVFHANMVKLGLMLPPMSYGAHTIYLYKCDASVSANSAKYPQKTEPVIENEYYKINFQKTAFEVLDKKTGKLHKNFHAFVDVGDAGDEYSYSWPDNDRQVSLEDVQEVLCKEQSEFCTSITVKGNLRLPAKLTQDRKSRSDELVDCPFTTTLTLYKNIDIIDIETEIDNRAEDHRLQVEFPSGSFSEYSSGSAHFDVTRHLIDKPVPDKWEEYPLSTALTHGFADAGSDACGISLASHGIVEYEAVNRGKESFLRLTLLRCVGWLSRPDLNSRTVNGGWECETPGGQCKGVHNFRYSVIYRNGSWREAGTFGRVDRALHPVRISQPYQALKYGGNPLSFISSLPPLIRLSALKPSAEGDGMIVRFYSLDKEERTIRLPMPEEVARVRLVTLAEKHINDLPIGKDRMVELLVRPGKIISLELSAQVQI